MVMRWMIKIAGTSTPISQEQFYKDQVIYFRGLYRSPSYIRWYTSADKGKELHVGSVLTFTMYDEPGAIQPPERFLVRCVDFDVRSQQYIITARQAIWELLSVNKYIKNISYARKGYEEKHISPQESQLLKVYTDDGVKEGVSGFTFLKNLLSMYKINVMAACNLHNKIGYYELNLEPDTNLLTVIAKICKENDWEFFLIANNLYISHALSFAEKYIIGGDLEADEKRVISSEDLKMVATRAEPAFPGCLYGPPGEEWRVVWVKYYLGEEIGSLMNVCLYRHLDKFLPEEMYAETLIFNSFEAEMERIEFLNPEISSRIMLGRIGGEIKDFNFNEYSSPLFTSDIESYSKQLSKLKFFAPGKQPGIFNLHDVTNTTPYAGDGVGLLFPQTKGHKVLLTPFDEREMSIIGPSYFGPEEEIPKRNKPEDFRLQLPLDSGIYYDSVNGILYIAPGSLVLQEGGMKSDKIIPEDNTYFISITNGVIKIANGADDVTFELYENEIELTAGQDTVAISKDDIELTAGQASIKIDKNTNKISLKAAPGYNELSNQVIIDGTLVVRGLVFAEAFKTQIVLNYDAAIMKKMPPGPA